MILHLFCFFCFFVVFFGQICGCNPPLYAVSVGQGHLETRSDGGDCNVDTTEAFGTGRLKSIPNFDLATKPRSHEAAI